MASVSKGVELPAPGLSVLGYLDDAAALTYLERVCVGEPMEAVSLEERLRHCRKRLDAFQHTGDHPIVEPLPARFLPRVLAGLEMLKPRASLWRGSVRPALIEIRPLRAMQISVSMPVVNRYLAALGRSFTPDDLVDLCLPQPSASAAVEAVISRGEGCLSLKSEGADLRVAGSGVFADGRVLGVELATPTGLVEVADVGGHYILTNGHHRACALQAAGAMMMPCVVWECASLEEAGFRRDATTLPPDGDRPAPCVGQFAEHYAARVMLRRVRRMITVKWEERMVAESEP